ncbi:MAG: hypothetical protein WCV71_02545 [Patescibacteria group bacterium]|jgi:hypothetical protein
MKLIDHPGDPELFSGKLLVLVEELPKIIGISCSYAIFMANQTSPYLELCVELAPFKLSVVTADTRSQETFPANIEPPEAPEVATAG